MFIIDWTVVLKYKCYFQGCSRGKHNPEKPAEPVRPKSEPLQKDEIISIDLRKTPVAKPRPAFDQLLIKLTNTIAPSLQMVSYFFILCRRDCDNT